MKVRIIGAGAVGAVVADKLVRVTDTAFIVDEDRKERYKEGLLINGEPGYIVGIKGGNVVKMAFPKERVPRILDINTNDLCRTAKDMGVCFGQE